MSTFYLLLVNVKIFLSACGRDHRRKLGRGCHGVNQRVAGAPAVLRRERRWVRSVSGGEFNAALVAPSSSAEGRNLASGMERQPGRSGAVCRSVARGVLGQASLSAYGSVRWLKVWRGGGCKFQRDGTGTRRNGGRVDAECRLPSLVTNEGRIKSRCLVF